jgi:hypothetical protein
MRTQQKFFLLIAVIVFIVLSQGCVKDSITHTYSYVWFEPLYKTSEQVRESIKSDAATEIKAPGKLFIKGNYIFLNEINKGVHIIDNSNPSAPVNKAFINIPGNIDIAVKGNILYADLYTDLLAIDISDPMNVVTKKIVDNVFPSRYYDGFTSDTTKVIYTWVRHDTTVTEDYSAGGPVLYGNGGIFLDATSLYSSAAYTGGSPVGIAGSMARFAVVNDYMYTVGTSDLKSINISTPQDPVFVKSTNLSWGVETIYPFKNKLFIGASSGMFIYDISNAAAPEPSGSFSHARVCDPVIADDDYAYVTLRNGSTCAGFLNELDIVDIKNLNAPVLAKKYDMTNPHGLSKDGNTLFICDGAEGLRIFNVADVNNMQPIKQIKGMETYDVIAYGKLAIVIAKDGLYQFDYSDLSNIHQLSKISLGN